MSKNTPKEMAPYKNRVKMSENIPEIDITDNNIVYINTSKM